MRYRNMKTGAVIDVPSELRGNWVPVTSRKAGTDTPPVREEETAAPAKKRSYSRKKK